VRVEKLEAKEGDSVSFDKVLLSSLEGNVKIGAPYISGAKVEATVKNQGRGEKKITFKYRPKARHHRTKGHRQPFTEIEITAI
jgi:large subunit ribosomal protein L21